MKRRWIWLAAGIALLVLLTAGCTNHRNPQEKAKEDAQTLCGKVESVDGDTVVLKLGTVDDFGTTVEDKESQESDWVGGILSFMPNGETKIIEIADSTTVMTMDGVKKTEAAISDVGTGDILAVTLDKDIAIAIVIHRTQQPG